MSDIYEGFEASALRTIIEEHEKEIARLGNQITFLGADITRKYNDNLKAAELLEAYITANDLNPEEDSNLETLCELLGVELTQELEIAVIVTYCGTVTVPRGTTIEELSVSPDWEISINHDGVEVGTASYDTDEITDL